jgi:hypothetical protein
MQGILSLLEAVITPYSKNLPTILQFLVWVSTGK